MKLSCVHVSITSIENKTIVNVGENVIELLLSHSTIQWPYRV